MIAIWLMWRQGKYAGETGEKLGTIIVLLVFRPMIIIIIIVVILPAPRSASLAMKGERNWRNCLGRVCAVFSGGGKPINQAASRPSYELQLLACEL